MRPYRLVYGWPTILLLTLGSPPAIRADDDGDVRVIRVAAVSFVPAKFQLEANANRMAALFRQARRGGAARRAGREEGAAVWV